LNAVFSIFLLGGVAVGANNTKLIVMQYSSFTFCSAPLYGGGVYVLLPTSMSHCFFDRCFTAGNSNCEGGGMFVQGPDANFSFCIFVGCYTSRGGGGMTFSGSVLRLEDTVFISCSSPPSAVFPAVGGGARVWNTGGYFRNCSFVGCLNGCDGGGLGQHSDHVLQNKNILCEDCIFAGNTGGWDGGGACFRSIHVNISSCYFYDNTAERTGGGVVCQDILSVTLSLCTFARNRVYGCSVGGGGGGFQVVPYTTSSVFDMSDNVFYGNLFDVSNCNHSMLTLLLFF
jgi:hypothetical protein